MKEYPAFRASEADVIGLLDEQPMLRLVTVDEQGWPRVGLHVFVHDRLDVEVHLVNDDPQLEDMRKSPRVAIEVDHLMSFSPSHWVDETDATYADQYYRCACLRGTPELVSARSAITDHLNALLRRYQPEGRYRQVVESDPLYHPYLGGLTLVRLQPSEVLTKFKLAQKAPAGVRSSILAGLAHRNAELDRITSSAIEHHGSRRPSQIP